MAKELIENDELMLQNCFSILKNFVEIEKLDECFAETDWLKEVNLLYDWWTNIRPSRKPIEIDWPEDYMWSDELPNGMYQLRFEDEKYPHIAELAEKAHQQERDWYEEDTEMLIRLVKIRSHLWT